LCIFEIFKSNIHNTNAQNNKKSIAVTGKPGSWIKPEGLIPKGSSQKSPEEEKDIALLPGRGHSSIPGKEGGVKAFQAQA